MRVELGGTSGAWLGHLPSQGASCLRKPLHSLGQSWECLPRHRKNPGSAPVFAGPQGELAQCWDVTDKGPELPLVQGWALRPLPCASGITEIIDTVLCHHSLKCVAMWYLLGGKGVHSTACSFGMGNVFMAISSGASVHFRKYYYYDIFRRVFEGKK